jgi:hypothetical protein
MKLHPSDYVAMASVGYDIVATAILWHLGQNVFAVINLIVGILIVVGVDAYEDLKTRNGGKLTWLDWMQVRDLIATMHGKEAIVLILSKAYHMTEDDIEKLTPQDVDKLMRKLKVEQAKT